MHPPDCGKWEFDEHPQRKTLLPPRVDSFLARIEQLPHADAETELALDTRPLHGEFFKDLTPADCPYLAGHYRGEAFKCLRHRGAKVMRAGIVADDLVGSEPKQVAQHMILCNGDIRACLGTLDEKHLPGDATPAVEKLIYSVALACKVFVYFLQVHPYANGNGHMARCLLWLILMRFGYRPAKFTIDPRPFDPEYSDYIKRYRRGEPELLEKLVFSAF